MRKAFYILAFLVLSACGHQIDSRATSYVQAFQAASVQAGNPVSTDHLIVEFGTVSSEDASKLGVCQQGFLKTPKILVDENQWNSADETTRTVVMFHELGHCVLNRDHKDGITDGEGTEKIPVSVMNSDGLPTGLFLDNQSYYLKELFSK